MATCEVVCLALYLPTMGLQSSSWRLAGDDFFLGRKNGFGLPVLTAWTVLTAEADSCRLPCAEAAPGS
jgi:hypothetical protein